MTLINLNTYSEEIANILENITEALKNNTIADESFFLNIL